MDPEYFETLAFIIGGQTLELTGAGVVAVTASVAFALERCGTSLDL